MVNSIQLAELVCARFTHDLSGLLGSLAGVLELVVDASGAASEELSLAAETASEMSLRLHVLRAAWGGTSEPMDLATLRRWGRGVVGGHRLELDLDGLAEETPLPPSMARLVLNVLLLAAEGSPRGGVLALSGDAATRVVAQLSGPGSTWPAGLALCCADEAQAWAALENPRALQVPLTALIAQSMGMRLSFMMASASGSPPPLLLESMPCQRG
jgi:histidine phosphotransferase ChpT